jgi:hypothetical protein
MKYEPLRALRVYEAILRGQGLDPAKAGLLAAEKGRIADLVTEAVATAWRKTMWPALMNVKRICYREEWSATTEYATGAEVYRRNAEGVPVYWRCLGTDTGTVPGTDAAVWEVPADFVPGFYYCAHFVDELDLKAGLFAENPDLRPDPRPYELKPTHYGACAADRSASYPAEPWIWYRPMPPEYSWTAWAVGTAYVAGELAFHGDSSWLALVDDTGTEPGTDAAVWAEVPFPKMFLPFVVAWVAGMRMQDDDGKAAQLARADRLLDELEDRLIGQTRVRRRVSVRVC